MDEQESGDVVLVEAINDAFDQDGVPPELTQFALAAISWRVVDDELAALTYDSATSDLVGVRGTSTQRHSLRFEGRGISVSVTLTGSSLLASVEPHAIYDYVVEGPGVSIAGMSDDVGQIEVDQCALPVRIIVNAPAGRLVSPWITG